MHPNATWLLHHVQNNQTPVLRSQTKLKKARWVLCLEAKLDTGMFDAADTAERKNKIRISAIFHSNTLEYSEHTFR